MRGFILGFIFLNMVSIGQAQNTARSGNINFQKQPISEVLNYCEGQFNIRFFYKESWIDDLHFTGKLENVSLEVSLETIFKNTPLNYFIQGDRVYLTNNIKIIENPEIASSQKGQNSVESSEKGMVFEREYLSNRSNQIEIENRTIEIGIRKNMVSGGKSLLAGYIKNAETEEPVAGAFIFSEGGKLSTTSDENGFYSLTLPNGKIQLFYQYLGMKTTSRNLIMYTNGRLDVMMNEDILSLQEVTISSDRDANIKGSQMGISKINVSESKNMPVVLGERDIIKIATTLPGIQTIGEGASGLNIRGGKSDQNLMLLNGATVYNTSHFFGFFSIFNSDIIEDLQIYKGSIPVKYDSRLSAVLDVTSKKASTTKFEARGGISPITSRLTFDVPVIKDKAGLLIGVRSTYSNWVLKRVENANFKENKVSFYDASIRYDHQLKKENFITASAYFSNDKFRLPSDTLFSFSDYSYHNANGSLSWKGRISNQLNGLATASFSNYGYQLNYTQSKTNAFKQTFDLKEGNLLTMVNYYPKEEHDISIGINNKIYFIEPGIKVPVGTESIVASDQVQSDRGLESAFFISDEYTINPTITVYAGLRYAMYGKFGPQSVYQYEKGVPRNSATRIDTLNYDKGNLIAFYHGLEPRISVRYALNDVSSVKASYNRTRQNIHTLTNSASLSPTDIWRLSDTYLKPQIADQISVGWYQNDNKRKVDFSAEFYFRKLQNLIDFKTGEEFIFNKVLETAILQGPGKSYGAELSIRKNGKLNGWINYTYSRTLIQLKSTFQEENINGGAYFPTNYDKPHSINAVANYKLTRRVSFSYNLNYSTGRPVTYPVAAYDINGIQIVHYGDRNEYRIPDYFRMDVGFNIEAGHKIKKFVHNYWSFSIYNVLARENPYSVFFDVKDGKINGYQLIIFGTAIPTISYNFRF